MGMIETNELTKYYADTVAIQNITFNVEKGEIVGFLGPNGAGKSTTMKILSCFMPATSGTAKVAGYDVFSQSMEVRRNIGYLPENYPFYSEMRVAEYLNYRAQLKGLTRDERRRRVAEVMEQCWITDVQRKVIGRLSKGYRQRVALAEVLLHSPPILIMDEPTVGLDPNQIRQARQLIKDLGKKHTILLSTHILPEVEMICERVIIVNKGRVVADSPLKELEHRTGEEQHVLVEVHGTNGAVKEELGRMDGVKAVRPQPNGDWTLYRLETQKGKDPREEIFRTAVQRGWQIRELKKSEVRLEDMFTRLVLEDQA